MIYLPDVNVWIALVAERHVHHGIARRWFESLRNSSAHFCRVTQMAFLKLLTNPRVLAEDVVQPEAAWHIYDALRHDSHVGFSTEPEAVEERWRALTRSRSISGATWTDTYLMSFAESRGLRPVSFDRAFSTFNGALILTP